MRQPDLSVIVVTYNAAAYIEECLASALGQEGIAVEVIVVDNASSDDTVALARRFPEAEVIANRENLGFAAANNRGLREAGGRNVMLLNPDTYVFPGTLAALCRYLDAHPRVGAVGPRSYLDKAMTLETCLDKPPSPWSALAQLSLWGRLLPQRLWLWPLWRTDWEFYAGHQKPCRATGIGGAYFMVSRKLAESLGGLDEDFYLGYEDSDWSHRIRRRGLEIHVPPGVPIVHYFGQSKRRHLLQTSPIFRWDQGLLTFLEKRYHPLAVGAFRWGMGAANLVATGRSLLQKRAPQHKPSAPASRTAPLTLTWPQEPGSRTLFELSNTPRFLDKHATLCDTGSLTIPEEILERLITGTYHWRAVELPAGRVLGQGAFTV